MAFPEELPPAVRTQSPHPGMANPPQTKPESGPRPMALHAALSRVVSEHETSAGGSQIHLRALLITHDSTLHPQLGVRLDAASSWNCQLPLLRLHEVAIEHLLPSFTAAELNQLGTVCKTLAGHCRDSRVWCRLLGHNWPQLFMPERVQMECEREMYRKLRRCDPPLASPRCPPECTVPSDVLLLLELRLPTRNIHLTSNFPQTSIVRTVDAEARASDDNYLRRCFVFSHPDVSCLTEAFQRGTEATLFLVRKFDGKVVNMPLDNIEYGTDAFDGNGFQYEGVLWPSPGELQLQRLSTFRDGLASTELNVQLLQIWKDEKDGKLDEQDERNNIVADKVALFIQIWEWTEMYHDAGLGAYYPDVGIGDDVGEWIHRAFDQHDVVLDPEDNKCDFEVPDIPDTLSGLAWK